MDAPAEAGHRAVLASWTNAEDTLYGPLLADPQGYERVVGLVGKLVAHLRTTVFDVPHLVVASGRGAELAAEVDPEAALPWVPLDAAVRAACAMRHRELLIVRQREDRKEQLATASREGAPWARIIDAGSAAAAVVAPLLVVHLASGRGVRCTTEMDPETGGARFVSSPVTVDVHSGEVTGRLDGVGDDRVAPSAAGREAQVAELQELIEGLDTGGRVV